MSALNGLDETLRQRIVRNLTDFSRVRFTDRGLIHAAVALALVPGAAGEPSFLLTRRTARLSSHGGQFALPGGRVDPGEDAERAALRELSEELGVTLDAARVLGCLDDFATRSGYAITPVVVWGPDVERLVPSPHEVAVAYRVPLRDLYRPDVPILCHEEHSSTPILSLPLVGTEIFSPTAAIIFQLREVALEGRDTRVHHYEQPRFAWK